MLSILQILVVNQPLVWARVKHSRYRGLASLNRDTANANQAVEKADLSAIQEKQETAQVIGDAKSVYSELEKQNKDKGSEK
ncbi:hypothetical protein V6W73_00370 [Mannheimia sp. HC-2023]